MSEPLSKEEREEWAEVLDGKSGPWGTGSGSTDADKWQFENAFRRSLLDLDAAEAENERLRELALQTGRCLRGTCEHRSGLECYPAHAAAAKALNLPCERKETTT